MKRISLLLLAISLSALSVVFAAPVRYEAKVWRAVQTYDLATLSKNVDTHMRELVAVKCNFRGKDIHHRNRTGTKARSGKIFPARAASLRTFQ